MNIHIPPSFEEVIESEFENLTGNLNVQRLALADGEFYYIDNYYAADKHYPVGRPARVGLHTTSGQWYVDSEFFPKAKPV